METVDARLQKRIPAQIYALPPKEFKFIGALSEFEQIIGRYATWLIYKKYYGRDLTVPNGKSVSTLSELIGHDLLCDLVKKWGYGRIQVPVCFERNSMRDEILSLTNRGWSASKIAEHLGCTTRSVRNNRTRHG